MLPILYAVANRISREEAALGAAFGKAYTKYCGRTKRLIPWLV